MGAPRGETGWKYAISHQPSAISETSRWLLTA